jgi:hypothetical protein
MDKIKATLLANEVKATETMIIRYHTHLLYDPIERTLTTWLQQEMRMPVDYPGYEGMDLVAQRESTKANTPALGDACWFLDLVGEYNKAGALTDIEYLEVEE